jgi:hypothetical protein
MTAAQADLERRGLYRAGGISAVVLAVLYVVITGLYVTAGLVPSGTEAWLTYLAGNMLRSTFGRLAAYLGVATGLVAIVAASGSS